MVIISFFGIFVEFFLAGNTPEKRLPPMFNLRLFFPHL